MVGIAGHTALHHAAVGGYEHVVQLLISTGANVEEQNENGHTPLMESASAGHVAVAKILLNAGAGINTHSNEFKESALTLACYKGMTRSVGLLVCFERYINVTARLVIERYHMLELLEAMSEIVYLLPAECPMPF